MPASRRSYGIEFKGSAVDLVRKGDRTLREVSTAIGVPYWTLRGWYNKDLMARKRKKGAAPPAAVAGDETPEQRIARLEREVAALRRENESLKVDREILKKAAAFFVKESE